MLVQPSATFHRVSLLWASLLAAPALAAPVAPASPPQRAIDRQEALLHPLTEEGGGAPSAEGAGKTVVLTEFAPDDAWYAPVRALGEAGFDDVVSVAPWDVDAAFEALAQRAPEHVVLVLAPTRLDVNFHFDFLERATRLDSDPFVDFTFGHVTGATPEAAARFAQSAAADPKLARDVVEFGPKVARTPLSKRRRHAWAKGFKARMWFHPEESAGLASALAEIKPDGLLSSWGNGGPDGIAFGLTGADLAATDDLDLSSAILFATHPHAAVPIHWYDARLGGAKRAALEPGESFLLGLLERTPAAFFGGLEPNRGETNRHQLERVLSSGSLGDAAKTVYDDVVLATGTPALRLPRYEDGKKSPYGSAFDRILGGSASRVLFGVPSWTPYPDGAPYPFEAEVQVADDAVEFVWYQGKKLERHGAVFDVLHSGGGWTHRVRLREEVPLDVARDVKGIESVLVTRDGSELVTLPPTGAVELWCGRAYLHVTAVFPEDVSFRPLWGAASYSARARFTR
ncbi:MAG: hypothetical protein AAFU73_17420 [Planctomycetota bacterium]